MQELKEAKIVAFIIRSIHLHFFVLIILHDQMVCLKGRESFFLFVPQAKLVVQTEQSSSKKTGR